MIVTIVAIAVLWFPYDRYMITGIVTIVTIAAVTALVVSINFLRLLMIVHNRYDRRDKPGFHMIIGDRS